MRTTLDTMPIDVPENLINEFVTSIRLCSDGYYYVCVSHGGTMCVPPEVVMDNAVYGEATHMPPHRVVSFH